jgi:hypothetical protein
MNMASQTAASAATAQADPIGARTESRACDSVEEMTERHLIMLKELAEIGMDLARTIRQQAEAEPEKAANLAQGFAHVAKAVRQTVALEAKLAEGPRQASVLRQRKKQIRRTIERAIEDQMEGFSFNLALCDLHERLEGERFDEDILDLPPSQIIQRICKLLGVKPDWEHWQDEAWAVEEREAAEAKAARPSNPPLKFYRLAGTGIVRPPAPHPPRVEDS